MNLYVFYLKNITEDLSLFFTKNTDTPFQQTQTTEQDILETKFEESRDSFSLETLLQLEDCE